MTLPSEELLVEEWRKRLKEYALTVQEKLVKGIEIKPQDAAYLNMYCVDRMTNDIGTSLDQMTKNITSTLEKTDQTLHGLKITTDQLGTITGRLETITRRLGIRIRRLEKLMWTSDGILSLVAGTLITIALILKGIV